MVFTQVTDADHRNLDAFLLCHGVSPDRVPSVVAVWLRICKFLTYLRAVDS
jgi:hypothetical protein